MQHNARLVIRLPLSLIRAIRATAKSRKLSLSAYVRSLLAALHT